MENTFIKLLRSETTEDLLASDPNSFLLLSLISIRARREKSIKLDVGEAFVGDHKACGLTRQKYRESLKRLTRYGLISYKTTNKGTICKLLNNRVFDINQEENNHPATIQQPSSNHPATTNKNVRKKECKNKYGEFKNVLLTSLEYEKLKEKFNSSTSEKIENLSEYMARTGKSYKSHYLTVLKWYKDEKPKKESEFI